MLGLIGRSRLTIATALQIRRSIFHYQILVHAMQSVIQPNVPQLALDMCKNKSVASMNNARTSESQMIVKKLYPRSLTRQYLKKTIQRRNRAAARYSATFA